MAAHGIGRFDIYLDIQMRLNEVTDRKAPLASLGQLFNACNDDSGEVVLIIADDDGSRSIQEYILEWCTDRV